MFTLLGSGSYHDQFPWQKVHFFWVDKRCVPREHEASNFTTVFDPLLSRIPVSKRNIHRIKGENDPKTGDDEYEVNLKKFFALAGFLALKVMAVGGVYIGGGIAPKIVWKLKEGSFMKSFIYKGRLSEVVSQIPVKVAMNDKAALLGAAYRAMEMMDK